MTTTVVPTYEALARDIKALGTEQVFGLMSDDTALFVTALDAAGIRFCGARHENNAIAMAEGYASSTGRLAIAVLGRGPATANAIHGATYAQRCGTRVLLIFGEAPAGPPAINGYGPDWKGFNGAGVLAAAGLRVVSAGDARSARRMLARAVAATHQGAVAYLLPTDVQVERIDPDATAPGEAPAAVLPRKPARTAAVRAAAGLLAESRRPLFIAGLGAHRSGARDAIIALADHVGAALATSLKGKDLFRGHPCDCGVVGSFSHAAGRRMFEATDCVVVFGAGFNFRTTSSGTAIPADVPVIQVDCLRNNIGRFFHADVGVVADAKLAAEQLKAALPARADADKPFRAEALLRALAEFDPASEFQPQHTPRTVDPRALGLELDRLLPANRNCIYDAGNFLQIVPYLSVPGPGHVKVASDFASIGMGFGAAVGYAHGTPDRTTVLILGDGSFLMTLGELETVAREGLPMIIVVMNDCAYGAELHYLKLRDMPVALSVFPDVDFAQVAEGFGFQAATVRTLDDLRAAAPLLAKPDGPILLDCKINAAVAAPFMAESLIVHPK